MKEEDYNYFFVDDEYVNEELENSENLHTVETNEEELLTANTNY